MTRRPTTDDEAAVSNPASSHSPPPPPRFAELHVSSRKIRQSSSDDGVAPFVVADGLQTVLRAGLTEANDPESTKPDERA
jgi:hypothetical protein